MSSTKTIIKYYDTIHTANATPVCDLKMTRKKTPTLPYIGYVLVLVGGIIIILFGLLDLLEVGGHIFRDISLLSFLSGTTRALFQIAIGIVCTAGSKFVSKLVWAIVLLVLGIVAGTIGGTLVAIGAILGIVSLLLKFAPK
jgi:hypothetical protein